MTALDRTLERIEKIFTDVLVDKKMNTFEKNLASALGVLLINQRKKKFTVKVINKDRKEPFFCMRVRVDMKTLDEILIKITNRTKVPPLKEMCDTWSNIKDWVIEIDYNVFSREEVSLNPKELTAIVLHEIGHIIYSEKPMEIFYNTFLECNSAYLDIAIGYIETKYKHKKLSQMLYFLYRIPLSFAVEYHSIAILTGSIEKYCDGLAIELGYGSYLASALNKMAKAYGQWIEFASLPDSEKQKIKKDILEIQLNPLYIKDRIDTIKGNFLTRFLRTSSNHLKNIISDTLEKMGIFIKKLDSGEAMECSIQNLNSIINENGYIDTNYVLEFSHNNIIYNAYGSLEYLTEEKVLESLFKEKKPVLPTQYDIDIIGIEIDRIESSDDKIYVLDLIYEIMEKINTFKDYISYDTKLVNKYSLQIDNMMKQLNIFRELTLNKKYPKKKYGLFVNVPEEYRG